MPAKLRKIWQTAAIAHCKNAAPAYAHASSGPSAKERAAAIAAGHGWRHVQAVAHIDATLAPPAAIHHALWQHPALRRTAQRHQRPGTQCVTIRAVLSCETARITLPNGPYCNSERPILERPPARTGPPLGAAVAAVYPRAMRPQAWAGCMQQCFGRTPKAHGGPA